MKEIDPLNFLKAVYMNAKLPLSVRMRAAIEILPFTHPKLAVVAQVTENDIATLLDRRIKRYEEIERMPKTIEHNGQVIKTKPVNGNPQTIDQPQIEAPKPLPRIADRRFRRM